MTTEIPLLQKSNEMSSSIFSSEDYYSDSKPDIFVPYKKKIIYWLKVDEEHIVKYSLGGFIIGVGGCKIKEFTNIVNGRF